MSRALAAPRLSLLSPRFSCRAPRSWCPSPPAPLLPPLSYRPALLSHLATRGSLPTSSLTPASPRDFLTLRALRYPPPIPRLSPRRPPFLSTPHTSVVAPLSSHLRLRTSVFVPQTTRLGPWTLRPDFAHLASRISRLSSHLGLGASVFAPWTSQLGFLLSGVPCLAPCARLSLRFTPCISSYRACEHLIHTVINIYLV